jgi:hypothetical protein
MTRSGHWPTKISENRTDGATEGDEKNLSHGEVFSAGRKVANWWYWLSNQHSERWISARLALPPSIAAGAIIVETQRTGRIQRQIGVAACGRRRARRDDASGKDESANKNEDAKSVHLNCSFQDRCAGLSDLPQLQPFIAPLMLPTISCLSCSTARDLKVVRQNSLRYTGDMAHNTPNPPHKSSIP